MPQTGIELAPGDSQQSLFTRIRLAGALYIRGLALMKSGHRGDGADDVAVARKMGANVEDTYARYGLKP